MCVLLLPVYYCGHGGGERAGIGLACVAFCGRSDQRRVLEEQSANFRGVYGFKIPSSKCVHIYLSVNTRWFSAFPSQIFTNKKN